MLKCKENRLLPDSSAAYGHHWRDDVDELGEVGNLDAIRVIQQGDEKGSDEDQSRPEVFHVVHGVRSQFSDGGERENWKRATEFIG